MGGGSDLNGAVGNRDNHGDVRPGLNFEKGNGREGLALEESGIHVGREQKEATGSPEKQWA
jgi:hypothetical protein